MDMITVVRQLLFDRVSEATTVPVLLYIPGEANECPAFVIGRPDVDEGDSRAVASVTTPIHIIGRTAASRDDDTQRELDLLADLLVNTLWKARQEQMISLRLTRMRATVTPIGNVEYPSYTATTVASTAPC